MQRTHPQGVMSWIDECRDATNDSARDVRAADLQEDLVNPFASVDVASRRSGFIRPDEDGWRPTNIRRERSEQSNRARVRAQHKKMGEAPVKYELPGAS